MPIVIDQRSTTADSDRHAYVPPASDAPLDEVLLPPALTGTHATAAFPTVGRLSWYSAGPDPAPETPPLLLIHSISAASSAYDMRPLYDHYRRERRVYALELPGFGFSQRSDRMYTPRLMTDAVHAFVAQIRRAHGAMPLDVIALSLSCEFTARAAVESPASFRSLAFVSPTGFEHGELRQSRDSTTLGREWLLSLLLQPTLGRTVYRMLTSHWAIRYFLSRTWGSRRVDAGLIAYDHLTSRAPGAEFAPLHFLSGYLFSGDSGRLYRLLRQPVWMSHATRGAFARVPGIAALSDRRNWSIEALPAGAMPHFETPEIFLSRYEAWAASLSAAGSPVQDVRQAGRVGKT